MRTKELTEEQKQICRQFKARRQEMGLNQEDLAKELGCSLSSVGKIESFDQVPSAELQTAMNNYYFGFLKSNFSTHLKEHLKYMFEGESQTKDDPRIGVIVDALNNLLRFDDFYSSNPKKSAKDRDNYLSYLCVLMQHAKTMSTAKRNHIIVRKPANLYHEFESFKAGLARLGDTTSEPQSKSTTKSSSFFRN